VQGDLQHNSVSQLPSHFQIETVLPIVNDV
jgi:hypothetical protein